MQLLRLINHLKEGRSPSTDFMSSLFIVSFYNSISANRPTAYLFLYKIYRHLFWASWTN